MKKRASNYNKPTTKTERCKTGDIRDKRTAALALTPEMAREILMKDAANLRSKVASGAPLSASERRLLLGIDSGDGATGQILAANLHELSQALNVDRRTLSRWKKLKGSPVGRPDGRYNVSEWRAFKASRPSGERDGEPLNSKEEQTRLQNQKLSVQVEILKKEWVRVDDVEQQVGQIVLSAKRVLLALPSALAPQVVGSSLADAERLIRDGINDALAQLHYDPAGMPFDDVDATKD